MTDPSHENPGASARPLRCFVGARLAGGSARQLMDVFDHAAASAEHRSRRRPRGRRVRPENLHVTLLFLGATPEDAVPGLIERVRALDPRPLRVEAIAFTGLPRPARTRNVVAELADHARLRQWHLELKAALGGDERPFRPHVTVERLDRPRSFRTVCLAAPLALELDPPALYLSDQTGQGVRYRPLH